MKKLICGILTLMLGTGISVSAEEIKSPVQEVEIQNSYLTKAMIKTNSKTEIQTIKIQKSFLCWVTVKKEKETK